MVKFVYNYFGYNEIYIKNQNAILIQYTYSTCKNIIYKKIDMIRYGNKITNNID